MNTEQYDTNDFVAVDVTGIAPEHQKPVHETIRYDHFVRLLFKAGTEQVMALHSALGVTGEAGELGDAIKKEYVYGKPRNLKHIIEELGDLEFYMQSVRNHYGLSRAQTLQANAEKLSVRYVGLKYSDEAAIARADKLPGE